MEVAMRDLPDVSESDSSEIDQLDEDELGDEQQETPDEAAEADGEGDSETETKSQRRRRMRREREEAREAEISRLAKENERLRQRASGLKQPKPDQFNSDAEYWAAMAAYNVRRADTQEAAERINSEYRDVESGDQETLGAQMDDFLSEGTTKYKDFADKVKRLPKDGGPMISPIMAEALIESDMGIDVAYYLASNTAEAAKIAKLPPVAQARAIWELEGKVQDQRKPAMSKAPPPVKPVRGSSGNTKPVSEMSMSEYAAYRNRQINGEA
jgi:hypothetical protein